MIGGGASGPCVCQCDSVWWCHHQLGPREGAQATTRRWGHFSVAHQSAPGQHLTTPVSALKLTGGQFELLFIFINRKDDWPGQSVILAQ